MIKEDPPVSTEHCAAYREGCQKAFHTELKTLEGKVDGLRSTIVTGISVSATVISIIVIIVNLLLR